MTAILDKARSRVALTTFALLVICAAVAIASTTVTVTKTDSGYASAFSSADGLYTSVTMQELDTGTMLYYSVYYYSYDPDTGAYVYEIYEQGRGTIPDSDVTYGSNSISLDTDTSDIAIVGEGGDIVLEWSVAPGMQTETKSKTWYKYGDMKRITMGKTATGSAIVNGTVFGEDFTGTGNIQTSSGKVILQVKD